MQSVRKIAIVSRAWTAYVYRLMLGSLSYAAAHPNFVTRDFRLFQDPPNDRSPDPALRQLIKWNPNGLICFLETEPLEQLIQSLPQSRPIVNMCAVKPMPGVGVVTARLATMIELGVRHLREQGLRAPAYLVLQALPQQAYFTGLFNQIARPADLAKAAFVEIIDPFVLEDPDAAVAPVPARLANWLRQLPKPVGVFCQDLGGGGYLIRVCHELGLRVPEDVAVVGVDDDDLAIASNPPLTTVLPAAQHIGREAMQLLDEMMSGKAAPAEPVRLEAMNLHVRESTSLKRAEICDIAAALEYINQHACQGVSVEQVIKETQKVSKVTFHKHFQTATGQTPGEAIQQRQMEEVRRLLANTELSMTTIAEHCGFGDSSGFARSFRAFQGMSPRDFRKQARGKIAPASRRLAGGSAA